MNSTEFGGILADDGRFPARRLLAEF